MKSTVYKSTGVSITLLLRYNNITVGEVSSILREWQALLRAAWNEAYEIDNGRKAPTVRLLTTATSSMHSIELVAEYAIHAANFASDIAPVLGPAIDWPKQAATAYGYLEHLWRRERKRREGNESIGQIEITGRHGSSIRFPSNVLERENTARRLLQFWDVANRGDIEVSARINVPPEEEEEEHPH